MILFSYMKAALCYLGRVTTKGVSCFQDGCVCEIQNALADVISDAVAFS